MTYVKSTRIVENTWICSSCKETNLGRYMKCQKCGSVKEEDEKDIVPAPATAASVEDVELLKLANDGPNWTCSFCQGQTRNAKGKCINCAAPKIDPKDHEKTFISSTPLHLWAGSGWDRVRAAAQRLAEAEKEQKARFKKDWRPFIVAWSIAGGALVAVLSYWLIAPREVEVTVSSTSWKFTTVLKQKTLKHDSGWGEGNVPADGFNVSCQIRYYGDENCHAHSCRPHSETYECNCRNVEYGCHETCSSRKNGFSSCSTSCSTRRECSTCERTVYDTCYDTCPVYRDWCEYDFFAWPEVARKETSGSTSVTYWPDLEAGVDQKIERSEVYKVIFSSKDDAWDYTPANMVEFSKFNTGATWKIRVRRIGLMTTPLEEVR